MASPKTVYRDIKYPRLEFKTGELELILPAGMEPGGVVNRHQAWIDDKQAFIDHCLKNVDGKKLQERSLNELRSEVATFIVAAEEDYGMVVNGIRFLKMRTKWASCGNRGKLTINTLMAFLPSTLIRYVIFHEVAHLLEKRHNERFQRIISARFADHDDLEKALFTYWFLIQHQVESSSKF